MVTLSLSVPGHSRGHLSRFLVTVSERIDVISTCNKYIRPAHRPSYINVIPLIDIIRAIKSIKSVNSKIIFQVYNDIINSLGNEYGILLDKSIKSITTIDLEISKIINVMRKNLINYTPGGGGKFGMIKIN